MLGSEDETLAIPIRREDPDAIFKWNFSLSHIVIINYEGEKNEDDVYVHSIYLFAVY